MDVSVIIVSYNTCEITVQCIRSVIELTRGVSYEIIVVDNNSGDHSAQYIEITFPMVRVIRNESNKGFGQANNIGIAHSSGKYILLLNSDTWLLNNAASIFFNYMEDADHRAVACCGGALYKPDGSPQVSFGNFPSLLESFSEIGFYILYKSYFQRYISSGVINYNGKIKEVDYVSGADMFIRRSVLDETGPFDQGFFLYYEETELSLRFKRAGFSSMLLPEAKIVHLEGASLSEGQDFNYMKLERFAKSRALFFQKRYGSLQVKLMKFFYCLHQIVLFIRTRRGNLVRIIKMVINA